MAIPGYDPEDLDDALERRLSRAEVESQLTDEQLRQYDDGDEGLVDLLDDEEIRRLVGEDGGGEGAGNDAPEDGA